MGKGSSGGSSAPSKTTSVTTNLPEYAQPFYTRLAERTEAESLRPYETYGGQRYATFSPEQDESFDIAANIARQGVPDAMRLGTLRTADAAAYRSPYDATQIRQDIAGSQYTPGDFGAGSFVDPGVASRYMNPFVENVIDAQSAKARRRFAEDVAPGLDAEAVRRGAFGGSRAALTRQLAEERLDDRLTEQEGILRAQAYRDAQGAFTADAARRLKEQQLADTSAQQAAKFGLAGAEMADRAAQMESRMGIAGEELGLKAGSQLSALAGQEQATALRSADVLRQIGEQRQAEEQQLMDIGLSDFLSQRDFPRQQLGYLSGILHGVPVDPQSETSVYQRPPSAGQQLLGYGLGGLGLAKSVFS